jgi:hypothetical protein
MELKEYIKETLVQISEGIEAAQTEVRDCGGFVNPAHRTSVKTSDPSHFGAVENGQNIFLVDFDVSISVIEGSGTDAHAKLKVASLISLGAGGKSSQSSNSTNRISFKVPLGLPVDAVSEEQLNQRDARVAENRRKQTERIRSANRRNRDWV